jgi:cell division protein FtsQ
MRILAWKRPAKAMGYRSNQWKGPRAIQSMDEKRQARRARRSARCRQALRISAWVIGTAAVCWTASILWHHVGPLLQRGLEIREVAIEGMHQVTRQEVLERLALKKGLSQHQVSLSYLAERVRSHPWIKEAMVERLPLHGLRVTVVERKPAAVARIGSEHILTDEEGVALTRLGTADQVALPLLLGVDGLRFSQGDLRLRQRIQSAIELSRWMAQSLDGRVEVDVSHPMNLVASAKGARFHFGSDSLKEQWERFIKVKTAFRVPPIDGRKPEGHDVDLRYANRVIVRERG